MKNRETKQRGGTQSIQAKLFVFLGFIALVLIFTMALEIYMLNRVSKASKAITEQEVPIAQAINEALVAAFQGGVSLDLALDVETFSNIELVQQHESAVNDSVVRFETFLAAIMWGSETEAFRKSDGGLNYAEWNRLGFEEALTSARCCPLQRQFAGITDVYFGGFAQNALRAIVSHKKFLRLQLLGEEEMARNALVATQEYSGRAIRFLDLTTQGLSRVVAISNESVDARSREIENVQRESFAILASTLFVLFALALFVGSMFIRENITAPLYSLTIVARKIGSGDLSLRAPVKSNDEIGELAKTLNTMTDRLAKYPSRLKKQVHEQTKKLAAANERLETLLQENYQSAKLLVQKDRELTVSNLRLEELNRDLNETAKILVRRDLQLSKSNERLQELDVMKSQFVSVAAHQLRTPLTGIKWTVHALLTEEVGPLKEEQEKIARDAYDATVRLIGLVNDLLDVSRLEEGRFGFNFKAQQLLPLVQEAIKLAQDKADKKGITIKFLSPKGKIPKAVFDGEKIKVVLENLVDNAIKYTPAGGIVRVKVEKEEEYIIVSVEDTGIGITEEERGHIFERFYRAHNAQRYHPDGTGLGLYLTKNIVEQHKGTISFKTKEMEGSTFSFTLPIA